MLVKSKLSSGIESKGMQQSQRSAKYPSATNLPTSWSRSSSMGWKVCKTWFVDGDTAADATIFYLQEDPIKSRKAQGLFEAELALVVSNQHNIHICH